MNFRLLKISAFALAAIASWNVISADLASAATVTETFDFNNIGNNSSSYSIQSYMAGVLNSTTGFTKSVTSNPLVTLTGALGQQGTNSYTGENHVAGPMMGGTPRPLTLGDTNGSSSPNTDPSKWDASTPTLTNSTDGFLKNCTSIDPATNNLTSSTGCYVSWGTNASSPDIFLNLSNIKYQGHAVEVASFSFDFEIFPDGTCSANTDSACGGPKGSNGRRPNLPDLEVWSGDNGTGTSFATWFGVTPSGANKYSVAMPGGETAPQLLGTSGLLNVAANLHITSLDFMDWPETIGIDNLVITFRQAPEPASIAIMALALVCWMGIMARRKRARGANVVGIEEG